MTKLVTLIALTCAAYPAATRANDLYTPYATVTPSIVIPNMPPPAAYTPMPVTVYDSSDLMSMPSREQTWGDVIKTPALPPAVRATPTTQGWGPLAPERHGRN